jgi:opacity protein-like surface antigen
MNKLTKYVSVVTAMMLAVAIQAAETTGTSALDTSAAPTTGSAESGRGSVGRAQFTTNVADREPVDDIATLQGEERRVYFFTELNDMIGHGAAHRWEYDGRFMNEVKFDVQGPRWRVWSYKTISPAVAGTWTVKVLNDNGEVIGEKSLVAE